MRLWEIIRQEQNTFTPHLTHACDYVGKEYQNIFKLHILNQVDVINSGLDALNARHPAQAQALTQLIIRTLNIPLDQYSTAFERYIDFVKFDDLEFSDFEEYLYEDDPQLCEDTSRTRFMNRTNSTRVLYEIGKHYRHLSDEEAETYLELAHNFFAGINSPIENTILENIQKITHKLHTKDEATRAAYIAGYARASTKISPVHYAATLKRQKDYLFLGFEDTTILQELHANSDLLSLFSQPSVPSLPFFMIDNTAHDIYLEEIVALVSKEDSEYKVGFSHTAQKLASTHRRVAKTFAAAVIEHRKQAKCTFEELYGTIDQLAHIIEKVAAIDPTSNKSYATGYIPIALELCTNYSLDDVDLYTREVCTRIEKFDPYVRAQMYSLDYLFSRRKIDANLSDMKDKLTSHVMNNMNFQFSLDLSELWYVTPESLIQAETAPEYIEQYNREKRLITHALDDIVTRLDESVLHVDLGPGDGKKTQIFCEEFFTRNIDAEHCLVDILAEMNDVAAENIGDQYTLHKVTANFLGLAHDTDFSKKKAEVGRQTLYTLLGTTFCNFEPDEISASLRESMGKDDYAVIGVQLFDGDTNALVNAYQTEEVRELSYDVLRRWGFPQEFDENLLEYYTGIEKKVNNARYVVQTKFELCQSIEVGDITLKKGQKIEVIKSYKYTQQQMEDILSQNGFSVENTYVDGNIGLFLIRTQ